MLASHKKRLTIILVLIMVSSMFAGFVFNVKQFKINLVVSYSQSAVFNTEVMVVDNTTAVQALSSAAGMVSINQSIIQCINELCNDEEGNWTAFNNEMVIDPLTYIVKPNEVLYFVYLTNSTGQEQEEQQDYQATYDAIRKLLKMD